MNVFSGAANLLDVYRRHLQTEMFCTQFALFSGLFWEQRYSKRYIMPKKSVTQETTPAGMSFLQIPGTSSTAESVSENSRDGSAVSSLKSASIHFSTTVRMLAPVIWSRIQSRRAVCYCSWVLTFYEQHWKIFCGLMWTFVTVTVWMTRFEAVCDAMLSKQSHKLMLTAEQVHPQFINHPLFF